MEIIFGPEEAHGVSEMGQKSPEAPTRVGARPTPLGAPPYLVVASETSLACFRRQNLLYIPKLPERNLDQEFRRHKPLEPPKTNLDPVPAP